MADFDDLNTARGALFRTVNKAVNNAAFSLVEASTLNELLANPLAADHLLLKRDSVEAKPPADIRAAVGALDGARATLKAVLDGANSKDKRRAAIDAVDAACETFDQLMR